MMAPPAKGSSPTPANQAALEEWLLSIMAFRPETVDKPWTFYEEIDKYLGPWGKEGYPIAYGKKYCVLFSSDERLAADLAGRSWIRRTLILLQVSLKDFILARYKKGTLKTLTEPELRKAAFDSHPRAYTEGGLTMVVMLSPRLAAHVATIPAVEFIPTAPSFGSTVVQVVVTAKMVLPRAVAQLLAGAAGPAHTGILVRAMAMDRDRLMAQINLGTSFYEARRAVASGRCDNIKLLEGLRMAVSTMEMPDSSMALVARGLLDQIDLRIQYVRNRYQAEIKVDPDLYGIFKVFDPRGL
jgi:hypothetical protein